MEVLKVGEAKQAEPARRVIVIVLGWPAPMRLWHDKDQLEHSTNFISSRLTCSITRSMIKWSLISRLIYWIFDTSNNRLRAIYKNLGATHNLIEILGRHGLRTTWPSMPIKLNGLGPRLVTFGLGIVFSSQVKFCHPQVKVCEYIMQHSGKVTSSKIGENCTVGTKPLVNVILQYKTFFFSL